MTWLLEEHHIPPWEYYNAPEGGKELTRAIYDRVMERRRYEAWDVI